MKVLRVYFNHLHMYGYILGRRKNSKSGGGHALRDLLKQHRALRKLKKGTLHTYMEKWEHVPLVTPPVLTSTATFTPI